METPGRNAGRHNVNLLHADHITLHHILMKGIAVLWLFNICNDEHNKEVVLHLPPHGQSAKDPRLQTWHQVCLSR
jgi:hypothetical protein